MEIVAVSLPKFVMHFQWSPFSWLSLNPSLFSVFWEVKYPTKKVNYCQEGTHIHFVLLMQNPLCQVVVKRSKHENGFIFIAHLFSWTESACNLSWSGSNIGVPQPFSDPAACYIGHLAMRNSSEFSKSPGFDVCCSLPLLFPSRLSVDMATFFLLYSSSNQSSPRVHAFIHQFPARQHGWSEHWKLRRYHGVDPIDGLLKHRHYYYLMRSC